MESRLNELEAKFSFADDLLDALNRTVYQQQQQIDELKQEVRGLRRQLRDAAPADSSNTGEDVPPHY